METIGNMFKTIGGVFSDFGFVDLLDVIFVAVIIATLIIQVRRTQSLQLIKGVVVVLFCYAAVNIFQMKASQAIFTTVMSNILLIVVVIFNTEIRNFLSKVGQAKWGNLSIFTQGSNKEQIWEDCINSVCRACASMSDDKVGSLMVFQRKANLGDLERTGVQIDAISTTEMLLAIFFPNAALHDGAIIIKDGRIVAARCVVPLKTDRDIREKFGTRHRAAMEATRGCDAIAVVTSEETGIISVAMNGELQRGITDAELREILMENLLPSDTGNPIGNRLKKFFRGGKNNE